MIGRNIGSKSIIKTFFPLLWILFFTNLTGPAPAPAEPYILHYPAYFGGRFTIPGDNPMSREGVYLGRLLFYEKRLSKGNQMSCAGCHQQKLAFTDGRALSVGVDGASTRRNSMSLSNLLWVRQFFWDGRAKGLEVQASFPLTDPHEMAQSLEESASKLKDTELYPAQFAKAFGTRDITPDKILKALAQFERTLISSHSNYDLFLLGQYKPSEEELRGMKLFMTRPIPEKGIRGANCGHCHGGPKTFLELFHNNGLDSLALDPGRMEFTGQLADHGRFRVPTLRNIALTAPYMHDGRFETLEQVVEHYNERIRPGPYLSTEIARASNKKDGSSLGLTGEEKRDLLAFLHMLTDSTFILDPAFSDPHSLKSAK